MNVTILGSGTSHGIPVVGCDCAVCRSDDTRNKRTRSSILIRTADTSIVVDTSPEFRLQAVRESLKVLDAVLFTHPHADHLNGLDDVRPLSVRNPIPVFGNAYTLSEIRSRFPYLFRETKEGGGIPRIVLREVGTEPFHAAGISVTPVPIFHGSLPILGYRIGGFAYLTDCSLIPETSYSLLQNLDVLVIDALRHRPHGTHFNVESALSEILKIAPGRAYLTHMSHDLDHETLSAELPRGVAPLYDGMNISGLRDPE